MSEDIPYDRSFDAPAGAVVNVSPLIRRIVAPNAGPFTFTGTCTYIVGRGNVAVIDAGPDSPAHIAALKVALKDEKVTHCVVTHTHRDHSPAARLLAREWSAKLIGCAPHRTSRELVLGEINALDASADKDYLPDEIMAEEDSITGPGWTLTALDTPGHTANHIALALPQENALFSGDHVMAWSTTIVAPPDGAMAQYMASLDKLKGRTEAVYWPGHGGPVNEPQRFVRALIHHRRQREQSILNAIEAGLTHIFTMVPRIYEGLDPRLQGAAALSVYAHLEDLVSRNVVTCDTAAPSLAAAYRLP
jgi:glyoxylase-like metal-dependent hydrolase (beta-lactamase superfamily II)